jgi:hypothetical protein
MTAARLPMQPDTRDLEASPFERAIAACDPAKFGNVAGGRQRLSGGGATGWIDVVLPPECDDDIKLAAVSSTAKLAGEFALDSRLGFAPSRPTPTRRDTLSVVGRIPSRRARWVRAFVVL